MADGIFLGGIAEGARARRAQNLQSRQIDLQEQDLQVRQGQAQQRIDLSTRQARQSVASELQSDIATLSKNAVEQLKAPGISQEQRARLITTTRKGIEKMQGTLANLMSKDGRIPRDNIALFSSQIEAAVPFEAKAAATATAAANQAEQVTAANIEAGTTPEAIAGQAALAGAETKAREGEKTQAPPLIAKLIETRDIAASQGRQQDAQSIQSQIDKLGTVVGRTEGDIEVAATEKARGRALGKAEAGAELSLGGRALKSTLMRSLLQRANQFGGGAVGIRAILGENVGGFLGQFNEGLGQIVTKAATGGMSQEELSDFRSDARTIVSQFLPDVTGEDSGRFTDPERRLAESIVRATEATATLPQLIGAIGSLTQLSVLTSERERFEAQQDFSFKVDTGESQQATARALLDRGLTVDQAAKTMRNLQFLHQELTNAR